MKLLSTPGLTKTSETIFEAIINSDVMKVKTFLKTVSPKLKDEFGRNPIHYSASRKGETKADIQIAKLILAKNRTEETDGEGNTALHYASYFDNLDIATYLLANGYCNQENNSGKTPLSIAYEQGYEDMVEMIEDST